jgi:hypothetical protein
MDLLQGIDPLLQFDVIGGQLGLYNDILAWTLTDVGPLERVAYLILSLTKLLLDHLLGSSRKGSPCRAVDRTGQP